jgi:hypothetical protein
MIRWLPTILMILGFPAWIVFWVKSPYVLVYLYMLLGYVLMLIFAMLWAADLLPCSRCRKQG